MGVVRVLDLTDYMHILHVRVSGARIGSMVNGDMAVVILWSKARIVLEMQEKPLIQ